MVPAERARTLTVESSRRALRRFSGRVPCQPGQGCKARVLWRLRRKEEGGMMERKSELEEARGRREANVWRDSRMPLAVG